MNIKLCEEEINKIKSDMEILILKDFKSLDEKDKNLLKKVGFELKGNDTFFDISSNKLFVSTLKLKGEDVKLAFSAAIRSIKNYDIKKVKISLIQNDKELKLSEIIEGLVLGKYEFTKYKSENKKTNEIEILISTANSKSDINK